ncbi:hypothetical protein JKG47_07580 [Acidithiobacillus sp. MC6.1]|nr:hypothetical protein [Acidithiobacillus sp. MC6.1]
MIVMGFIWLIGFWLVIAWAYIFIADYTWTTAAVVAGVLTLVSFFIVGIRRTAVGLFRLLLFAIMMVVMTEVVSHLVNYFTHNGPMPWYITILTVVAWFYATVKIFRLAF